MDFRSSIVLLSLCAGMWISASGGRAQAPVAAAPQAANAPTAGARPPSVTLAPALELVQTVLDGTDLERWKTSNAVRSETQNNLASIQRDLEQTLPGLIAVADGSPDLPSKVMPLYRNVEALYDVLLRVDAAGRQAAPAQQGSTLDQALSRLDESRIALGQQIQGAIEAEERHSVELEGQLKAAAAKPPPPAAVCPPVEEKPKPRRRRTAKPKSAAKPSTPSTGSTQH